MWYELDKDSLDPRRRGRNRRVVSGGRESIFQVRASLSAQRRERMHKVGALVLVLVVLAGTVWAVTTGMRVIGRELFSENDRFAIRELEIRTDGKLPPERVKEYAHVSEGMNLFAVDLHRIRQDLESVPIVSSVVVRRQLPDTLVIEVSQRAAAARIGGRGTLYPLAIDREGVVLGPTSVNPGLPVIAGIADRGLRPGSRVMDPRVKCALLLVEMCETPAYSQFVRVTSVDVSGAEFLDVRLDRGEQVLFTHDGLEYKLEKLADIIKRAADLGKAIAKVDMTVDRNFPVVYQ